MNPEQIKAADKAIAYMKQHLEEEITTKELADLTGYSLFHFTRIFKRATGISPRHFLSALRIEMGREELARKSSLTKAMMASGYLSPGTFQTRFKNYVGISPKRYEASMEMLQKMMDETKTFLPEGREPERLGSGSKVSCHIQVPQGFRGIIFAGLFPKPIPDQRPVKGTAFSHNSPQCIFTDVPEGTYYLLAAGLEWSMNPLRYFQPDTFLRGKIEGTVEITKNTVSKAALQLRGPLPHDPPILINLPLLLFEKITNKAN
ncbi:AraC family transcriptional regulator [Bacillus infantis]|uniref:helix-turn-helix domain-containing protein n=1 Tax=Bacillus infantis TaxID=324767 RepID=UPI001CD6E469|nr:AraC family transcriptional regulator [Bacillus infantis]MCA1038624.1 AraC family transcriptional regulator [Bacillus infantis]